MCFSKSIGVLIFNLSCNWSWRGSQMHSFMCGWSLEMWFNDALYSPSAPSCFYHGMCCIQNHLMFFCILFSINFGFQVLLCTCLDILLLDPLYLFFMIFPRFQRFHFAIWHNSMRLRNRMQWLLLHCKFLLKLLRLLRSLYLIKLIHHDGRKGNPARVWYLLSGRVCSFPLKLDIFIFASKHSAFFWVFFIWTKVAFNWIFIEFVAASSYVIWV